MLEQSRRRVRLRRGHSKSPNRSRTSLDAALLSRQRSDDAVRNPHQLGRSNCEHVGPSAGGGPDLAVAQKAFVNVDRYIMPDRRDAPDREARSGADSIAVGALYLRATYGRRQFCLVQPVVAPHQRHRRLAVNEEHERFHYLADLDSDCRGGVSGCLGALGEGPRLDDEPLSLGGRYYSANIPVHQVESIFQPARADRQPAAGGLMSPQRDLTRVAMVAQAAVLSEKAPAILNRCGVDDAIGGITGEG